MPSHEIAAVQRFGEVSRRTDNSASGDGVVDDRNAAAAVWWLIWWSVAVGVDDWGFWRSWVDIWWRHRRWPVQCRREHPERPELLRQVLQTSNTHTATSKHTDKCKGKGCHTPYKCVGSRGVAVKGIQSSRYDHSDLWDFHITNEKKKSNIVGNPSPPRLL